MIDKWICQYNITGLGYCKFSVNWESGCAACFYIDAAYGNCCCCRNGGKSFSEDCYLCSHYDPDKYDYTALGAVLKNK